MATLLELVQELHGECGAAGRAPTTVVGVTGEAARLVRWIKKSNLYVQKLWENWKFLRCEFDETLLVGNNALPAPTVPNVLGSGMWDMTTFKLQRVGETFASPLQCQEYDDVKSEVLDTSSGPPWRVVIMPDNSLRFESTPSTADTITADFYREPIEDELTLDADEPSIPEKFQRIIVAKALIYYGNYEGADEQKAQGKEEYSELIARMENSELPNGGKSRYRVGAGQHIEVIAS